MATNKYAWIIDPGHGKLTEGKASPRIGWLGRRFYEYEFNHDIASRLIKLLHREGIAHLLTIPNPANVGNALELRVNRANAWNPGRRKIFLSIHANAAPTKDQNTWGTARGVETWHLWNSTPGEAIAGVFQRQIVAATGMGDRGVKSQPNNFFVLRRTQMVAVLTESGFFNHPDEVRLLLDNKVRAKIAEAHFLAIKEIGK